MNNDELTVIEQLKQRYRKEAHLAIEDAREKAKKETEDFYLEKIKILEEENRKWKAIAEATSEESNIDTENDPKAPLVRYIMEGVRTSFLCCLCFSVDCFVDFLFCSVVFDCLLFDC